MMESGLGEEFISKADHALRAADHLVYITYPLLKDTKLIKKMLEEICDCTINLINALLFYEVKNNKINLSQDKRYNLELFKRNIHKFGLTNEEKEIFDNLLEIIEKHKQSSVEFVRKDKLIIMLDNLKTETLTLEKLKLYLNTLKAIMQKSKDYINKDKIK